MGSLTKEFRQQQQLKLRMAESCGTTRGAGNNRAFEDAANSRIQGELQDVESDLPEDIMNDAMRVFRAAISDKCTIQQAIEKGFIKFDYDTSVITINVNKFGNGNAQFSVGMGVKRMVCPDPFMGKLSDPNMNKK